MGFSNIKITQKSQDKGIDGTATKKIEDIINEKIIAVEADEGTKKTTEKLNCAKLAMGITAPTTS